MAKTIKFNLICDGYPARTIEDLQDHFSVEDLLDYYEKGLMVTACTILTGAYVTPFFRAGNANRHIAVE